MSAPLVVIPGAYADALASYGSWGTLDFQADDREQLLVVSGYSKAGRNHRRNMSAWHKRHYLRFSDARPDAGLWYRVEPEIHQAWQQVANRGASIPTEVFKAHVPTGWRAPPPDAKVFALAISVPPGGGTPTWSGWWVSRNETSPGLTAVVEEDADLLAPIADAWPLGLLSDQLVLMIGAGSIGSAAAESLASYGVRNLALVDPDQLLPHNFARHRVHPSQLGRIKVNALNDHLTDRDPAVTIIALPANIIDDANVIRPLLAAADAVLVTSDGVDSRRVANHLAHRASKPAVFACVLDDGAIGEILRVIPHRTGCLLCNRAALAAAGGIDPEPSLDQGYGTGNRHRPMTAVGGDLALVGQLAAKTLVSTLLERRGLREHRLPHDHAILGLRDSTTLAPPYDVATGELRWRDTPPPRPDCPTCSTG